MAEWLRQLDSAATRIGRDNPRVASRAVSVIREAYEALNAGGWSAEWAAANLPPDFELVPPPRSAIAGQRFTGPEGLSQFFAQLADAWETVQTDIEELVDFGDRVVAVGRIHNRGRGSGMEVDAVAAHLWTVDNDVPVRVELIGDREEALRRGRAGEG